MAVLGLRDEPSSDRYPIHVIWTLEHTESPQIGWSPVRVAIEWTTLCYFWSIEVRSPDENIQQGRVSVIEDDVEEILSQLPRNWKGLERIQALQSAPGVDSQFQGSGKAV
jgi:hypothetical protein